MGTCTVPFSEERRGELGATPVPVGRKVLSVFCGVLPWKQSAVNGPDFLVSHLDCVLKSSCRMCVITIFLPGKANRYHQL